MSRLPATDTQLRSSASRLRSSANTLAQGNDSLLLRFYGVECLMKSILLRRACPPAGASLDTTLLGRELGSSGHDLNLGLAALGVAQATLGPAPQLTRPAPNQPVHIVHAHQVWRYGLDHDPCQDVETWLKTAHQVLEGVV